ncbi:MAG TPA: hypothetical protein VEB86_06050 [Chryseosolibacter sp.]|nr:hypothetical protein [Chryseosolibacter sp.]
MKIQGLSAGGASKLEVNSCVGKIRVWIKNDGFGDTIFSFNVLFHARM